MMLYHRFYDFETFPTLKAPNVFETRKKEAEIASRKKHTETCLKNRRKRHNRNKRKK
jgi:hypothetical protein